MGPQIHFLMQAFGSFSYIIFHNSNGMASYAILNIILVFGYNYYNVDIVIAIWTYINISVIWTELWKLDLYIYMSYQHIHSL